MVWLITQLLVWILGVVSPVQHPLREDVVSGRAEIIDEDQCVTL